MKGNILSFDEATNRGKISGEDGKRYDFVRMDWKSQNTPTLNLEVDFDIQENNAKEIYCVEKSTIKTAEIEFFAKFKKKKKI